MQKSSNFQTSIETLFSAHGAHKRFKMKVRNNPEMKLFLQRAKTRKSCSRLHAGLVCEVLSIPKSYVFFEPGSALDMVPWYRCFRDLSRFWNEMGAQRACKKEQQNGVQNSCLRGERSSSSREHECPSPPKPRMEI